MKRLLLALAAWTGCLAPGCTATGRQVALTFTTVGTLTLDWMQTRDITRNCSELNPVLGECGQNFPVDVYFPLVIVGTLAAAAAFPKWSDVILGAMTGAEASTVWRNWAVQ